MHHIDWCYKYRISSCFKFGLNITEKLLKVPGQFTSLAGETVNNNIEDTFADSVHIVRVFRCVRRPQLQYKRVISLCENGEGTIIYHR